ncbi:putative cytochrome P450 [Xylogone sp. PMI_703]|nr:putative cytochrome P450 [Xylogone sp. PMI_703]
MATPNTGFLARAGESSLELASHITARFGIRNTAVIVIITIFLGYNIIRRIQVAYFSPLSRIPGPWHAHLTGLNLKLNILRGNRVNYVHALHVKYGPYVRVAHNEVVTCDPAAAKDIHAVGTRWRKCVPQQTTPNIFSIADPKKHNIRQRFYHIAFSQAGLRERMEPKVLDLALEAAKGIKKDAESNGGLVNVHEWFMLFGNDVMCILTFGEGFGLIRQGKRLEDVVTPVYVHQMIGWIELSLPIFLFGRFVLSRFSARAQRIFCADVKLNPTKNETVAQLNMRPKNEEGRTVFAQAIEDAKGDELLKSHGKTRLTDDEIAADALGFRLAGSEPASVTLTYLIWCVLKRPEVQKLVEEEVADVEITDEATEKLPILSAVILETLRLWGGNATAMRRREDETAEGTVLGGYRIPKGTTVSTQAYSLHRNPDVWEDAYRFDHTRWLDPSQSHALAQDRFQPFNVGTRMCAAYHLAMMEIRLMATVFFKTFPGAKLAPSVTDESMEMIDRFNLIPKYHRCEIIVKP